MGLVGFSAFAFWLALTVVTIRAASVRGRSVMMYFIVCVFFTPVIALIDVLVTTVDKPDSTGGFKTTKSIVDTYKE